MPPPAARPASGSGPSARPAAREPGWARKARWAGWAGIGLLAILLAVLCFPGALGAGGIWPLSLLISFRLPLAVSLGLGALVAAGVWLGRRSGHRLPAMALVLALVLALGAGGQVAVLAARHVATLEPDAATAPGASVTVLQFNTHSATDSRALAALVDRTGADIVTLPETDLTAAQLINGQLSAGTRFAVFGADVPGHPGVATAALVARHLGSYEVASGADASMSSFLLRRTGAGPGPRAATAAQGGEGPAWIGVIHTVNPVLPVNQAAWLASTGWATAQCRALSGMVMAGDFNATIDHPAFSRMGSCLDAAQQAGRSWEGTWPASVPPALGTPIDHVLADGATWRVSSFSVLPAAAGSDHLPVLARLNRAS